MQGIIHGIIFNVITSLLERLNPFWFISWIMSCLSAVVAQLVLYCNVQSRERVGPQLQKNVMQMYDAV